MTLKSPPAGFETSADVVIIGAGAAGLCAALAAREEGADTVLIERDPVPCGSTALSAGLIPAAGTRFQKALAIAGTIPAVSHATSKRRRTARRTRALVRLVARKSGPTVEWLASGYGLPFSVVHDFDYPGHCARRRHGLPTRSGVRIGRPIARSGGANWLYAAHRGHRCLAVCR